MGPFQQLYLSVFIKNLKFLMQQIQVGAARVLSVFLMSADIIQPYLFGSSFGLDDTQVACLCLCLSLFFFFFFD